MELCELVSAFRPKDVYPCTTDPLTWDENTSIRTLFGHLCSEGHLSHDAKMRDTIENDEELLRSRKRARYEEGSSQLSTQQPGNFEDSGPRDYNSFSSEPQKRFEAIRSPSKQNIDFSSSSSAARNFIPSSMESIGEHPHPHPNPNEPITIPSNTTESERTKRNEIRRAWYFLRSNLSDANTHLAPLSFSWPTEEEDGLFDDLLRPRNENKHADEDVDENGNSEGDGDGDSEIQSLPPTESPSPSPSPSPSHNSGPGADDPQSQSQSQTQPESQLTNTLSISDSAFGSSFSSSQQYEQQQEEALPPPRRPSSSISRNNRKAAYLAARTGTFDAWNVMSLVSAVNNHTEEEMEL